MKLLMKKSFLFGLVAAASTAHAADIVPTQFKAIETDLARSELQLDAPYSMRFGLNFAEGHRYLLHPSAHANEDSSSIRREYTFSLMLPLRIETGFALYDSQQGADESYGEVPHKAQKLGGAIYARYHLVQSEGLRSSILLQYEPGSADKNSFHQASQDKIGFVVAVDGTPVDYLQVGAYLGLTKRKDEKFRASRLNDEVLYGLRLSAGPDSVKLFGDMQIRSLPWKTIERGDTMQTGRHYEIGLAGSYKDFHIQASRYIPTTERFVGEPERGFKISVQYVLGKSSRSSMKDLEKNEAQPESPETLDKIEEKLEQDDKAPAAPAAGTQTPASNDSFDTMSSDVKEEGLGAIPVFQSEQPKAGTDELKTNSEVIEAPGKDEFEKWDATQDAESKKAETPTEKAEREYREQLAKEKTDAAVAAEETKSKEQLEKERLLKELEDEEKKTRESAADIEKELNQYTLPGPDETNWDGLGNR